MKTSYLLLFIVFFSLNALSGVIHFSYDDCQLIGSSSESRVIEVKKGEKISMSCVDGEKVSCSLKNEKNIEVNRLIFVKIPIDNQFQLWGEVKSFTTLVIDKFNKRFRMNASGYNTQSHTLVDKYCIGFYTIELGSVNQFSSASI